MTVRMNYYIRALGCQMQTIYCFGKWVDANNQEEFAAFLTAFKDGPVFEPGRQVAGFEQLKRNIHKATENGYAALAFVLEAPTGYELKRRMLQLKGLGPYRAHVMFSVLCMARLTRLVGRNGVWMSEHFIGKGAKVGLEKLGHGHTVATLHASWNPLRLTLDDTEHCLCAFHSFLKRRSRFTTA